MTDKYILDGKTPVPADLPTWAKWFDDNRTNRHVAIDVIGDVRISTAFLGLDHSFGDEGPPILFETMVFGGPLSDEQDRYATWEQAEAGHAAILARVRAAFN